MSCKKQCIKKYCVNSIPYLCHECDHFQEPKMTFFEAWQKAEEGDVICGKFIGARVPKEPDAYLENIFHSVRWGHLFQKEWTGIPKRRTVTIDIPEEAENVKFYHKIKRTPLQSDIEKITYEI